jgi:LytS/YehU family sensor histidine kinase
VPDDRLEGLAAIDHPAKIVPATVGKSRLLEQMEEEKRISEIEMLSIQINPHFLYNTLHTIKVLSIMQGVENIQTVSDALSRMLHLNLDARKFISIAEEEKYLQDYLDIQQYRYVGKLTYSISIEDSVKGCVLPKLLIQPIVENALQHGISKEQSVGMVQIRVYGEEEELHILVRNGESLRPEGGSHGRTLEPYGTAAWAKSRRPARPDAVPGWAGSDADADPAGSGRFFTAGSAVRRSG